MIIYDNWVNIGLRCYYLSINVDFVIFDWGGLELMGLSIFYLFDLKVVVSFGVLRIFRNI